MNVNVLNDKIMEMKEDILTSIQKNMRIESVRGEALPDAPYGVGPKAALMDVLELGEHLGFKTGHADYRMGWIEYGEGKEMVGVLGHVDVVPADSEGWTYPPFAAEIHDGVLWGRGVLDDKGPIIGSIYALKAIRDLNLPIDRRIRIMFGTDEECGCSCAEYYVNNGYEMPTIGFTPDGDFPLIFCEKGMSHFTIGAPVRKHGKIDVEYFGGGIANNVVTPKCKLIVNGKIHVNQEDGINVVEENGKTIVESLGLSAHGSTPHLGINAAIKLLNAIKDNEFGGDFQNYMDFLLQKIGTEVHGESLDIHYTDDETGETSLNLGVLHFDKEQMSFTLDIRYPKNAVAEEVDASVIKHITEAGFDVISKSNMNLLYVPKDSELVTKLMRVYKTETGRDEQPMAIGGGTYAKEFPNMVAFGPMFPEDEQTIHQPNERVEIEKLMKSIQLFGKAMYELAKY